MASLGIARLMDSVGVRLITPWNRRREELLGRAPRSFESVMGGRGDDGEGARSDGHHHVLHATIILPGGFAVMLLFRTSRMNIHAGSREAASRRTESWRG